MFDAPQYAGGLAPPPMPSLAAAAETVCLVLRLDPNEIVTLSNGSTVPRRQVIAEDCAMLLLLMQACACEGMEVKDSDVARGLLERFRRSFHG